MGARACAVGLPAVAPGSDRSPFVLGGRRVFYKVKSRSAHMKSHAEQEKKAAALRQKEKEAAAAAAAAAAAPHQLALREESGAGEKG